MFESAIISNEWMTSIGLTLLHSLWQLTAMVLLARLVVVLMPGLTANTRYQIYYATYLLSGLLVIGTFCWYQFHLPETMMFYQNVMGDSLAGFDATLSFSSGQSATVSSWSVTQLSGMLAALWLFGLTIVISVKFAGWHLSRRLRVKGISAVSADWQDRLTKLREQVQIGREVAMRLSALVKSPMMIGYLKPVILLPLGFFSSLSTDEIESILLHELAHIKRNDYLHLIFQQLLNALFFFHPASWVLNRLINDERENACDDFVVATTGDAYAYIMALGQMQMNISSTQNKMTMNLMNDKNKVLNRLRRLVGDQPSQRTGLRMLVLPCLFLIAGICLFFAPDAVQAEALSSLPIEAQVSQNVVAADTTIKKLKVKARKSEKKDGKAQSKAKKVKTHKEKQKLKKSSNDGEVVIVEEVRVDELPEVYEILPPDEPVEVIDINSVVEIVEEYPLEVVEPVEIREQEESFVADLIIVEQREDELRDIRVKPTVIVEEVPVDPIRVVRMTWPDTIPAEEQDELTEKEMRNILERQAEMQEVMQKMAQEHRQRAEEMQKMAYEMQKQQQIAQSEKLKKLAETFQRESQELSARQAELMAKVSKQMAERAKELAHQNKEAAQRAQLIAQQQQELAIKEVKLARQLYEERRAARSIDYNELVKKMNSDGLKVRNGEKLTFEITNSAVFFDKAKLSDKLATKYRKLLNGYFGNATGLRKIELSPKRVTIETED
ncbi:MAG: M56 family metallopeptidase [Bacteroidota bacterium]